VTIFLKKGINEMNYNRKTNFIFAVFAVVAGLLYSVADYLLEYLPGNSIVLDKYGVVESAWGEMAAGRFTASLTLAAIITPLFVAGYICVYQQMQTTHPRYAKAFIVVTLIGGLSDFFIHAILCIMPIVYKSVINISGQTAAVTVLEDMTGSFIVPFYIYFGFIFAGYILWFVYAFKKNSIYPEWYAWVLLTAVLIELGSSIFDGLQVLSIGTFSRLEMTFFIYAAVTEYKIMRHRRNPLDHSIINK
jgi:hypothetical protein